MVAYSAKAEQAQRQGVTPHVGNVLSSDVFYNADSTFNEHWQAWAFLLEMETAALYSIAVTQALRHWAFLPSLTILSPERKTTPEERQHAFTTMMELTLPLAQQ